MTITDALRAIEELPSTPRDLPCPGCPATTAMHCYVPGRIEASNAGAVRWWRCADCGIERALDSVAAGLPPAPEVLPC